MAIAKELQVASPSGSEVKTLHRVLFYTTVNLTALTVSEPSNSATWAAAKLCELTHLFICKDEQHSVSELVLGEHPEQLLPRLIHSLSVVAVHHKDQPWESTQVIRNGPSHIDTIWAITQETAH